MAEMAGASSPALSSASDAVLTSDSNLMVPKLDIVSLTLERIDSFSPTHPIFVNADDPREYISAAEVRIKVEQLATGLQKYGLKPGQCVCIHSYNSIWYPVLWLAIIAAGGIMTGSNPAYAPSELIHHFKVTDTRFVIAHVDCLAAVKEVVSECEVPRSNVFVLGTDCCAVDATSTGFHSWKRLLGCGRGQRPYFADRGWQDRTIAVHACTSGTTGLPKAAELSHKYLVTQASILEHVFRQRKDEVRQLICLPVFHAFASQLAIVLPLRLGITTFFMPRFDLSRYVRNVSCLQITDIAIVPPIVSSLLTVDSAELSSLRYVICAGAPLNRAVQNELSSHLHPAATVSQCWGATEVGWISLLDQSECDYEGSVGRLLPNTTLKLIDDDGNPILEEGIPGEACIKSGSMMNGYRHDLSASSKSFTHDGFYRTGDRVHVQDGKIFVVGRIKDIMKVKGWQVSPEELEIIITQLEHVEDCAVVAHTTVDSHGVDETKPRAFVVTKKGAAVSSCQVQQHVAENLVSYKRLTGGVVFTDAIIRSGTGKILRRKLVEMDIVIDSQGEMCVAGTGTMEKRCQEYEDSCEPVDGSSKVASTAGVWTNCVKARILILFCSMMGLVGLVMLGVIGLETVVEEKRKAEVCCDA